MVKATCGRTIRVNACSDTSSWQEARWAQRSLNQIEGLEEVKAAPSFEARKGHFQQSGEPRKTQRGQQSAILGDSKKFSVSG